ncbi:hypothetical protein [Psychroflexus planctonicus]|uniref:DUF983 domain-containing protein n=1 Tax=Psychroflexus planctonicus TaxID=1526575 RepID=A0ABQ1SG81_9FLAO|nr:hypothetical protein [Psychroflexus planctonicus]GGE38596.1 hypothetical protein GCM10010832_18580 [Psychroflexus planctonicus]
MKVYGKCKNCKNEIGYSTSTSTRVEFAMKEGENIKASCEKCLKESEFHVDELIAYKSNLPEKIAGITFMIVLLVTIYYLFFSESKYVIIAFGLPLVVYIILSKQEQSRVSSFNRRKLKGRIHNI